MTSLPPIPNHDNDDKSVPPVSTGLNTGNNLEPTIIPTVPADQPGLNPVSETKTVTPPAAPSVTPVTLTASMPAVTPVPVPAPLSASLTSTPLSDEIKAELSEIRNKLTALRTSMGKIILGQTEMIDQMLIALLCGGHALLEGVPGTAKTLAVRAIAKHLSLQAGRIQFTPDLMPSDITGTRVFNLQHSKFELNEGPVFTDLLLGDEINRAPAKTQAALLEAMAERQVTLDGIPKQLSEVFTVFATQNPIEFEGTYPLPEAQQDRFLFKIRIDYPGEMAERQMLESLNNGRPLDNLENADIKPIMNKAEVLKARQLMLQIQVDPAIINYILRIVRLSREQPTLLVGVGPRGGLSLLMASKAHALLHNRDFITPDDVTAMVFPTLGHRLVLSADSEVQGISAAEILQGLLNQVDVPR